MHSLEKIGWIHAAVGRRLVASAQVRCMITLFVVFLSHFLVYCLKEILQVTGSQEVLEVMATSTTA